MIFISIAVAKPSRIWSHELSWILLVTNSCLIQKTDIFGWI